MTRVLERFVPVLGLLLIAAACTPIQTAPPLTPQQIASRIDAQIPRLDPVAGRYAAGDFSSTWVAYFDGQNVQMIEERGSSGDYGNGTFRYYFRSGSVIYYTEDSLRRTVVVGPQAPMSQVSIRIAFERSGRVIDAVKTVNGTAVPIDGFEVQRALGHGAELRDRALALRR